MRLLVVTPFQQLADRAASGIYVRQRLFVDAIRGMDASVHVLLLAHSDLSYGGGPGNLEGLRALVEKTWGPGVKVSICQRTASINCERPRTADGSRLGLLTLPGYASAAGDLHRDAVESAIDQGVDIMFVHRLAGMPPVMRARRTLPPLCLDLDDIESLALVRQLCQSPWRPSQWSRWFSVPALRKGENQALAMANQVYVCSTLDADKLSRRKHRGEIIAVPNTVPKVQVSGLRCRLPHLLMVGNYGHPPNRHGVERFVTRIWPRILQAWPLARLRVAGPGGEKLAMAGAPPPGVEVLGFVDDLAALYADTALVVCPIYTGGGTRVKLVEAAAHGIPAVSTTVGAEGIGLRDQHDIVLADDDAQFARACLDLLGDSQRADRIGSAAQATAEARFDRDTVVAQLREHIVRLAESTGRSA